MGEPAPAAKPLPADPAGERSPQAAAHDLSNLLGIIIGNLDLLAERDDLDDEARELARESLTAALRGTQVVEMLRAKKSS
jgi:signal transduction histidine kinase